jgi:signal transduction histidine kinase
MNQNWDNGLPKMGIGIRVGFFVSGTAALSAVGAVGGAAYLMLQPRPEPHLIPLPLSSVDPEQFAGVCGVLALVWVASGVVLVRLRPANGLGWLVLGVGVSQAWAVALTTYGGLGRYQLQPSWPAFVGAALFVPGWLLTSTLLLAIYPDGRLPGPRWRWPVAGAVVAVLALAATMSVPVISPAVGHGWTVVPSFPDRLGDLLLPYKPVYRAGYVVVPNAGPRPLAPMWWPTWTRLACWVFKPMFDGCMVTIWGGTVVRLARSRPPRRQLLGIETVLCRGLVYGVITTVVVAVYLAVSAAAGALWEHRPVPSAGVVAAALAVVCLAPARSRLQHAADRSLYGERHDPLHAVTLLGRQLATSGEPELLPGALTSVVNAVRAPAAAVLDPSGTTIAGIGPAPRPDTDPATASLPLFFGGRPIGLLLVAPRSPGEHYTALELRLLTALALQVAVVVQAFELAQSRQAEHDRVLAATAAERDRIRAELHDGLGPSLSGIGLALHALTDSVGRLPRAAGVGLLERTREEVDVALGEVRRIIDGLRPAPLDTMTLPDAIDRHSKTISAALPVDLAVADLPRIPPQVENAAYRITTEALTNAARHAGARRATVTLAAAAGALRITVADDGRGLPAGGPPAGRSTMGLASMRRRAEALGGTFAITSTGGGTTVEATIPLEHP